MIKWKLFTFAVLISPALFSQTPPAAEPPAFRMSRSTAEQFNAVFNAGDFKEAADILASQKPEMIAASAQPEASAWLNRLIRAEYHSGDFASMRSLISSLRGTPLAENLIAFELLAQIDEGRAAAVASALEKSELTIQTPAMEMVRARIAYAAGDMKTALRHFSRVQAFHYREADWLAPALFYEALIYRNTGSASAESFAVRELKASDPVGRWYKKAVEELQVQQ